MRFLLVLLATMTTFSSVEAQRRPRSKLVLPEDTLFREVVVRRAIQYIKARKTYEEEADALADKAGYKTENIGVHGSIADYAHANDWCEHQKLSTGEKHEMFDLRLIHHPALRSYASKALGRNVAKKGFGWYIEGDFENDYNGEQKGLDLGRKFFTQALSKHDLKPCE